MNVNVRRKDAVAVEVVEQGVMQVELLVVV
jgi:hypothetical protein